MKVKFHQTKWGLAFDFEDRLCFLSNSDLITDDKEYQVVIYYKVLYYNYIYELSNVTKKIEKKYGLLLRDYSSKQEILDSAEYNLFPNVVGDKSENRIVPYCRILTEK